MTGRKGRRRAFTIVEILVVVIIIGVLATLIVPRFFGRVGQAKQAVATANIEEIRKAIDFFRLDYGRFPETLEELVARPSDVPEEKWKRPHIRRKDLVDPWGRQYIYKFPGDHEDDYDVYSLGADGEEGGEGDNADVKSWE